MRSSLFTSAVIWILILVLGVYTPGISVFKYVCLCNGEQKVSLLTDETPCEQQQTEKPNTDCCRKKTENHHPPIKSCCKPEPSKNDNLSCCKKTIKTLKLKEADVRKAELLPDWNPVFLPSFILSFFDEWSTKEIKDEAVRLYISPPLISCLGEPWYLLFLSLLH